MSDDVMAAITSTLVASPEELTVGQYQCLAHYTDRTALQGQQDLAFPLLGLFGEVGSLMAEFKKKQRDTDSYVGYEPSVIEELGDVLWYFSTLASRAEISLADLVHSLTPEFRPGDARWDRARDPAFFDIQPAITTISPKPPQAFQRTLMCLAGEVGHLVTEFSINAPSKDRDVLSNHMSVIVLLITN